MEADNPPPQLTPARCPCAEGAYWARVLLGSEHQLSSVQRHTKGGGQQRTWAEKKRSGRDDRRLPCGQVRARRRGAAPATSSRQERAGSQWRPGGHRRSWPRQISRLPCFSTSVRDLPPRWQSVRTLSPSPVAPRRWQGSAHPHDAEYLLLSCASRSDQAGVATTRPSSVAASAIRAS